MTFKDFITICLLNLLIGRQALATSLTIAYEDKEQFPYYLENSTRVPVPKPGIAVEMVQRIPLYMPDITIKLVRFPWPRCLSSLKNGTVDGIFNASFKATRLAIGAYPWNDKTDSVDSTKRITTISYSFYTLKSSDFSWNGQNVSHLDVNIGAPRGYSITDDLRKMGLPVEESNWTEHDFGKLLLGRISAAAAQTVTGDSLLKKYPEKFSAITKVTPPIKTKHYYLMLSHPFVAQHPKVAAKIWDTIEHIRNTELQEIMEKY